MRGLYPRYLFARVSNVVAILFTASHLFRQRYRRRKSHRSGIEWNASHFAIFFLRITE